MNDQEFEKLVDKGIAEIPEKFLEKLENVAIVIENEPSPEQLRKLKVRKSDTLFGLYEGVPQTQRGPAYGMTLPDKITVFKNPILSYARSDKEIKKLVKETVWHEIAHHFGSDETAVRAAERKRHRSVVPRRDAGTR